MQTNHSVMANTQQEFDDYSSKGYVVDDGTLKPQPTGGGGGGSTPTPTGNKEPYKEFVNGVQWNSEKAIIEFISGVNTSPMDKDKSSNRAILGGIIGGIPGAILGGLSAPGTMEALTSIAQLKATQMVAKAKGMDTAVNAAEKAIADIIKNSPGVIDKLDDYLATGKGMFAAIEKSEVYQSPTVASTPSGSGSKPPVVDAPAATTTNNDNDDGPSFPTVTQEQISQAQEQAKSSAIESGATQKEAEKAGTIAGGQMAGKGYVGGYGFNKGGLMAKGKNKKKK